MEDSKLSLFCFMAKDATMSDGSHPVTLHTMCITASCECDCGHAERARYYRSEPARTGLVATREDDDVVSWARPARAAAQSAVRHEEVKG